jgi:hypothetical protein
MKYNTFLRQQKSYNVWLHFQQNITDGSAQYRYDK